MIRKHTLEYDDVMNKQRQEIYAFRNELLFAEDPVAIARDLFQSAAAELTPEELPSHFPVHFTEGTPPIDLILSAFEQKLTHQRQILSTFRSDLNDAEKALRILQDVVRNVMIRRIDSLWQEHLLSIDHLRSDVHMQTVGQKDPLIEFKRESFALFERFFQDLRLSIIRDLFRFEMAPQTPQHRLQQQLALLQKGKKTATTAREGG